MHTFVQVFVKDLGKEYAGWPLNNMERTYKFLIKHVRLWKMAFHGTSPRWVHCLYLAALASYYAKYYTSLFLSTVSLAFIFVQLQLFKCSLSFKSVGIVLLKM